MEKSLQIQIKGKAPDGSEQLTIMEYIEVVREIEFTTNRMDSPGKLKFTCVEDGPIVIPEGSSVEYIVDGMKLFKGFVFTIERIRGGETSYTAYDQLRYLKANASYSLDNMSFEQILERIAGDFGLTVGKLEATGYVFPTFLKENEDCLNIVFDALSETIVQTGKIFILYDKAGKLTLVEAKNWFYEYNGRDSSLVTDYTYKREYRLRYV
mgnify:FL=1